MNKGVVDGSQQREDSTSRVYSDALRHFIFRNTGHILNNHCLQRQQDTRMVSMIFLLQLSCPANVTLYFEATAEEI